MSNDLLSNSDDSVFRKGLRERLQMKTLSDRRIRTTRERVVSSNSTVTSDDSKDPSKTPSPPQTPSNPQPKPLTEEGQVFTRRFANYCEGGFKPAMKMKLDVDRQLKKRCDEVRRVAQTEDYEQATQLLDKLEDYTNELLRKQALRVKQQRSLPVDPGSLAKGDLLGRGSFGEVFLATSDSDKPLVIKTGTDEIGQKDLEKEVEVYAELGHSDNIVKCYGMHEVDGEKCMVMEAIGGGGVDTAFADLNRLRNSGKLNEGEYWSAMQHLFRGVFKGLRQMEEAGFVHNDLKGDNVMFDPVSGEAKLVDVGKATRIGGGSDIGAMLYGAPEKIKAIGDTTKLSEVPSDITQDSFSAGQMLFGQGERQTTRRQDGLTKTGGEVGFAFGETFDVANTNVFAVQIKQFKHIDGFLQKNDKGEYVARALVPKKPGEEGGKPGSYAEGFESEYVKFLNGLMHPDPKQRLTPSQALEHPFLKDSMLDESSAKNVLAKMVESRKPAPVDPQVAAKQELDARRRVRVALREVKKWNKEIKAAQKVDEKSLVSIEHASKRLLTSKTSKNVFSDKELTGFKDQLHELTLLEERFTDYARMASDITRDLGALVPASIREVTNVEQYERDLRDLETLGRMSRLLTTTHGQITDTRAAMRGLLEDISSQDNRGKGEKLSPESPQEVRQAAEQLKAGLDDVLARLSRERKPDSGRPSDPVIVEGDAAVYEKNHLKVTTFVDQVESAAQSHRRGESILSNDLFKTLSKHVDDTTRLFNRFTKDWASETQVITRFEELTGAKTKSEKGRRSKKKAVALASEDRALLIALTAVKRRVEGVRNGYTTDLEALANARSKAIAAIDGRIGDMVRELPRQVTPDEIRETSDKLGVLEELLRSPLASPKLVKTARNAIAVLRLQIIKEHESQSDPNAGSQEQAELLLKFGSAKPPSSKGQSDSFFINGPDGVPKFILKPTDGESRFSDVWPEGGGAPREVLMSRVDRLIEESLGIKIGIPTTTVVSLDDPSFASGTKSKATKRVGALQETFKINDGDPPDVKKLFKYDKDETDEDTIRKVESLNTEDVESVALFDFLMLNADRHAENLMLQNPGPEKGQTRLAPIDSGQCLPSREAFLRGSGSMSTLRKFSEERPTLITEGENLLMQLPCAQQKLSDKAQEGLKKLDPDKFVEAMKKEYEQIGKDSPEMAGKIDDSSFELVRRSAVFLKAASSELTMYEISLVYSCGFRRILDAKDDDLDTAVAQAIKEMKEYAALGGDEFLMSNRVAVENPPLALHERLTLAKLASGDDEVDLLVEQYKMLCEGLSDIAQFIGDSLPVDKERAAKIYELRDKLVSYTGDDSVENALSPTLGNEINALIAYKHVGGDPMVKNLLEGNPEAYAKFASSRSISAKGGVELNLLREFFKAGGYRRLKEYLGDEAYEKIKGDDVLSHCDLLGKLMAGPPPQTVGGKQTSGQDSPPSTDSSNSSTTTSPNDESTSGGKGDQKQDEKQDDESVRVKILEVTTPNPTLWFDNEQFGDRYRVSTSKPKSAGDWMDVNQFCSTLAVRWINKPAASLTFAGLSSDEQSADAEQLINYGSLNDQVEYAAKAIKGKRTDLKAEELKDLAAGTRIWMGNDVHATAALMQAEGKVNFYDPNSGQVQELTIEQFAQQLAQASVYVVAGPDETVEGSDDSQEKDPLADLKGEVGAPKAFLKALRTLSGSELGMLDIVQYSVVEDAYWSAVSEMDEEANELVQEAVESLEQTIDEQGFDERLKSLIVTALLDPLKQQFTEKK